MALSFYLFTILFAAVSAFNLALWQLLRSLQRQVLSYLALGTLLFSICLGFAVYEITASTLHYPQLIWFNAPLLYAIGPLFLFQIRRPQKPSDWLHFLPMLAMILWLLPFYCQSPEEKLRIITTFYETRSQSSFSILQYLYTLHFGLYCGIAYYDLQQRNAPRASSLFPKEALRHKGIEILYLLLALSASLSFLLCLSADFLGYYNGGIDRYTLLLLVVLILCLQFYFAQNGYEELPEKEISIPQQETLTLALATSSDNPQTTQEYAQIMVQLEALMRAQKLYQQADLKISMVADTLGISVHQLSAAINQGHGNNFFDYVNQLRIEELKITLLDNSKQHLTLLAIARESGFQSNSSFYRVFKKYVGCTPKQYILQATSEQESKSAPRDRPQPE